MTAYNPRSDGQSERTNAIMETMLRCLLVGRYEADWVNILPDTERIINVLESTSTGISPFELFYGVKSKLGPQRASSDDEGDFLGSREVLRKAVLDVLELAQARMAPYFDEHHKPPEFTEKVYIKLTRRSGQKGYLLPQSFLQSWPVRLRLRAASDH